MELCGLISCSKVKEHQLTDRMASVFLAFSFVLNLLCNDQESCPGKLKEIHGKAGLFLEGRIHPELEGVEIIIGEKGAASPLITVFTDDKGAYR